MYILFSKHASMQLTSLIRIKLKIVEMLINETKISSFHEGRRCKSQIVKGPLGPICMFDQEEIVERQNAN